MFKITHCHLPPATCHLPPATAHQHRLFNPKRKKKTTHSKSLCLPVLFETKKKQSAGRVLSLTPPPPPPPPPPQPLLRKTAALNGAYTLPCFYSPSPSLTLFLTYLPFPVGYFKLSSFLC